MRTRGEVPRRDSLRVPSLGPVAATPDARRGHASATFGHVRGDPPRGFAGILHISGSLQDGIFLIPEIL